MKKNIICFMAGVIVTLVICGIYFNTGDNISKTSSQPSFEDKEKCMKYYDTYKKNLESLYNTDDNSKEEYGYTTYLSDYEFFYSKELDSCVSAYSLLGFLYDTEDNMKPYPNYGFYIVDYLNGEKELFSCYTDTYMDHLNGKKLIDEQLVEINEELKRKNIKINFTYLKTYMMSAFKQT